MFGELISLPLRLGWRASRTAVRTGFQVSGQAVNLAVSAVGLVSGEGSGQGGGASGTSQTESSANGHGANGHGAEAPEADREAAQSDETGRAERSPARSGNGGAPPGPARAPAPERDPEADAAEAVQREPDPPATPAEPPTPPEPGPAHVTEEARVVESFAEPGAEDGAGAQLRVDEPWEGYAQLAARDVISRIGSSSAEELAAIDLYERTHKNRETVVTAVERRLNTESGNRPAADET